LLRKYVLGFNLYVNYMPFVVILQYGWRHKKPPAVVRIFVNYFSTHTYAFWVLGCYWFPCNYSLLNLLGTRAKIIKSVPSVGSVGVYL